MEKSQVASEFMNVGTIDLWAVIVSAVVVSSCGDSESRADLHPGSAAEQQHQHRVAEDQHEHREHVHRLATVEERLVERSDERRSVDREHPVVGQQEPGNIITISLVYVTEVD